MIAVSCSCFTPLSSGTELLFSHDPCYPFSSTENPLYFQLRVNARASIFAPILAICIFDALRELFVILLPLAFPSFAPIGIAIF
jgi:hypothetical protein